MTTTKNASTAHSAALRAYMDSHAYHSRDIAEHFGVSHVLVGAWLTGKRHMSPAGWRLLTTLQMIAALSPDMHQAVGPVRVDRRGPGRPVGSVKVRD